MTAVSGVRVIGLTGGVASGKSSLARFITGRGGVVIDADELARLAVIPGSSGLNRIVDCFGDCVLLPDGTLDRKRVSSIVFSDVEKRQQLEQILHPEIRRLADEQIAGVAASGARVVFYMAPLLIESGSLERVDEVWVITVRPEIQLQRLICRDHIDPEQARRIIASQMPLAEKERYGRVVIDNSGTLEELQRQLSDVWNREIGEVK